MRFSKWIALALVLCLVMTTLLATLAEEPSAPEYLENEMENGGADDENLIVELEEPPTGGTEDQQELETPLTDPDANNDNAQQPQGDPSADPDDSGEEENGGEGYMVEAPAAALGFARVTKDQVEVFSSPAEYGVMARLGEGETVLIIGYAEKRVQVAFNGDNCIYEGFVKPGAVSELDAGQTADYLDRASTCGVVVLYDDDINLPLIPVGDNSSFGLDALMASANYGDLGNDTEFTINGKTIHANQFPDTGAGNCWAWAQKVYQELWGVKFESSFEGSASRGLNMLRNLTDEERLLTPEHLKLFAQYAQPGATIRVQSCPSSCSGFNSDGLSCGHKGHSLIFIGYDSSGVFTMDSHSNSQHTRHYTWQGFCNSWKNYAYFKYIKWPNASALPSKETVDGITVRSCSEQYRVRATAKEGVGVYSNPESGSVVAAIQYPATFKAVKRSTEEHNGATWVYGATDAGVKGWLAITNSVIDVNANISVTGVSINPTSASVLTGGRVTLTAVIEPLDATKQDVGWATSNESVATVSGGVVTGVAAGTATITAVTADGSKTATCEVKVSEATVLKALNKTGSNGMVNLTLGDKLQLSADFATAKGWKLKKVESSKTKVATVNKSGLVTPKGTGKTTITVTTKNGKKATLTVQVIKGSVTATTTDPTASADATAITEQTVKPTGVKLNKSGTVKLKKGKTLQLKATVAPANATTTLTWKSSNEKVAIVDSKGKVKGLKKGTCYIGVGTDNSLYAKVKIKVS